MTRKRKILVTGGAGYIGSHMVLALLDAGHDVVILDNFSTGHERLVPVGATVVRGDVGDRKVTDALFAAHDFDAVAHFAASIVVPESVVDPLKYYINNTLNTAHLIAACVKAGISRFIFSSTAAVYGKQDLKPIDESVHLAPDNPYGASKLMSETILRDTAKAHDLSYVVLRYFNVAGADPAGRSGQLSKPATHLIKIAGELVCGKRDAMQIFGTDYDTPDGTCIRDYIHITDLIGAHMVALDHLMNGGTPVIANCGYGTGASVRDVLASVIRVSGSNLNVTEAPRRAGDTPYLVADSSLLKRTLGWVPKHDDLDAIVKSALDWERKCPD
ncbi:UDP-glucose 4-epimerase GalE [Candidatus Puniceispirillum sp.]|uniref:UDP-glucose 4-epimerase GalE n=1 Tax=Candidatus Puniceispirillum sp. TaxID=2026719 RepID=UPI003F69B3C9